MGYVEAAKMRFKVEQEWLVGEETVLEFGGRRWREVLDGLVVEEEDVVWTLGQEEECRLSCHASAEEYPPFNTGILI